MNETQLQIVISAVNNAADALAGVQGSLSELSTGASDAAASITTSLSAAEQIIAEQAQQIADAYGTAAESIETDFAEIVPTTDELIQALVDTNQQAAAQVAAAWRTSGQAMEADLAAAMTEVETIATEGGEAAGADAAEGFGGYFKKMIVGVGLEQVGQFLSGGIESAVSAVAQSGDKISTLTAQIQQQRAEVQVNEAALQKWVGTTAEVNAAHEKAAANIEAEKAKIAELTTQLGPLTQAQAGIPGQITSIEDAILGWIGAHKQLETSLQTFMTTLGPMLKYIGLALIAFTLLQVALSVLDGPLLILIGIGLAIAVLTAIWETFHTQITGFLADLNAKTGIIDLFKQAWQTISDNFTKNLLPALQQLWTALQPLEPYLKAMAVVIGVTLLAAIVLLTDALTFAITLFTDILTVATKVATFFTTVLVAALNVVKSAIEDIINLVSKVGSVGGAIGGAISGALSHIPAFASGGIVNGPTLALVGEAGPEAIIPLSAFNGGSSLGGGGGNGGAGAIVININGGYYLDQNAAQQIGNALATSIGRQLKLKNFF